MEFLGVGPLELILVVLLALALIGPRDIGKHARTLGKTLQRLYRSEEWTAVQQASRNLRSLPQRLAREAELDEAQLTPRQPAPPSAPSPEGDFAWRRPSSPAAPPPETEPPG